MVKPANRRREYEPDRESEDAFARLLNEVAAAAVVPDEIEQRKRWINTFALQAHSHGSSASMSSLLMLGADLYQANKHFDASEIADGGPHAWIGTVGGVVRPGRFRGSAGQRRPHGHAVPLSDQKMNFQFTAEERQAEEESFALAVDVRGREVLTGLTLEETAFVINYRRAFVHGVQDEGLRAEFIALNAKHELSRLQGVAANCTKESESP